VDAARPVAVALEDATVAFRLADARVYTAVEQASLAVGHGEFVAIVGPTGCGKSTLLNVAAGLLKPAAGAVRIFDAPLTGLNRDAGYLFQADALFPWKTAIDNVAIGLEIDGVARAEALARAQRWLDQVGLGAFAGRYPHMLSGGQRKRVGLAQVLIRDPKILLMDEPFGPLDAQTR
jgi:NitT/TauT family transport system ATP-binding protein